MMHGILQRTLLKWRSLLRYRECSNILQTEAEALAHIFQQELVTSSDESQNLSQFPATSWTALPRQPDLRQKGQEWFCLVNRFHLLGTG